MVDLYVHRCPNHNPVLLFELNLLGDGDKCNVCLKLFFQLSQLGVDSINMTTEHCCVGLLQFDCLLKILNVSENGFLQEQKFCLEVSLQVMEVCDISKVLSTV